MPSSIASFFRPFKSDLLKNSLSRVPSVQATKYDQSITYFILKRRLNAINFQVLRKLIRKFLDSCKVKVSFSTVTLESFLNILSDESYQKTMNEFCLMKIMILFLNIDTNMSLNRSLFPLNIEKFSFIFERNERRCNLTHIGQILIQMTYKV